VNKQNVVTVRFTDVESAKLQDMAMKRGVTTCSFLRELVKNARVEPKRIVTWSIASGVEMNAQQAIG